MSDESQNFETPSWSKVITDAIDNKLLQTHTAFPAEIVSYDATLQRAKIQPVLKKKYRTGEIVEVPVINDVPVAWPRAGQAIMHFPLKAGDTGLAICSERSVDLWKTFGGKVDPKDTRKHDYSDAFFLPGPAPKINPVAGLSSGKVTLQFNALTKLELSDDGTIEFTTAVTKLTLKPSGKFSVVNPLGEFVAAISQLFMDIGTANTATALGLEPLIMPTFPLDKLILDSFKA